MPQIPGFGKHHLQATVKKKKKKIPLAEPIKALTCLYFCLQNGQPLPELPFLL